MTRPTACIAPRKEWGSCINNCFQSSFVQNVRVYKFAPPVHDSQLLSSPPPPPPATATTLKAKPETSIPITQGIKPLSAQINYRSSKWPLLRATASASATRRPWAIRSTARAAQSITITPGNRYIWPRSPTFPIRCWLVDGDGEWCCPGFLRLVVENNIYISFLFFRILSL